MCHSLRQKIVSGLQSDYDASYPQRNLNPGCRPGSDASFAGEEEKGQIVKCHVRLAREHGGDSAETRCAKSAQKRGYEKVAYLINH